MRRRKKDTTHKPLRDHAVAHGSVVVTVDVTNDWQEGYPDWFLYNPRCGWKAIEIKGARTPVSEKQQDFARRAPVDVCRTTQDLDAVIYAKPVIVCLCGDVFTTTTAMRQHLEMVHDE